MGSITFSLQLFKEESQDLANFFGDEKRLKLLEPFLAILDLLQEKLKRPLRILDIGAGTGMHAHYLVTTKGCEVFAVDPVEEMLAQGRLRYSHPKLHFLNDSLPKLETLDNDTLFDVVISIAVLQYIPPENLKMAIERITQAIIPGGAFVFVWPVPMTREGQYPLNYESISEIVDKMNEGVSEESRILLKEGIKIPDPDERKGIVDRDQDIVFHSAVGYLPALKLTHVKQVKPRM